MDTGLLQGQGLIGLHPGEVLRFRNAAGRHLGVVRGVAWVTQEGDARDHVLGSGETFRFERNGLALVLPLGIEAKLLLEEGLAAEGEAALLDLPSNGEVLAHFERRAHHLRAEAMAQAFVALAGGLKALWARIGRAWTAALQARKTALELRSLSDRVLNDIGLRRDQIDCFSKQVPC